MRFLGRILILAAFGLLLYNYQAPLLSIGEQLFNRVLPCARPIQYSLGSFDERFPISKEEFLKSIQKAETIWEEPIGKNLFEYREGGPLRVSLIYDVRQQTTEQLTRLEGTVDENLATYTVLKENYDALRATYAEEKADFEAALRGFGERQSAYNREVRSWNARGGAPKEEYERLQQDKASLRSESAQLETLQRALNDKVEIINSLVHSLNTLATKLNLNVARYNEVGRSAGVEFEEGLYEETPGSQKIEIYEFSSRAKLLRVLAHELGHALHLDHVDDRAAIMYQLNQGENEKATPADIAELKRRCGIE